MTAQTAVIGATTAIEPMASARYSSATPIPPAMPAAAPQIHRCALGTEAGRNGSTSRSAISPAKLRDDDDGDRVCAARRQPAKKIGSAVARRRTPVRKRKSIRNIFAAVSSRAWTRMSIWRAARHRDLRIITLATQRLVTALRSRAPSQGRTFGTSFAPRDCAVSRSRGRFRSQAIGAATALKKPERRGYEGPTQYPGDGVIAHRTHASIGLAAERGISHRRSQHQRHASCDSKRSDTCTGIVQAYIDRAKAYNGTCTALVTKDGKPIAPAKGAIRAGAPMSFRHRHGAVSDFLPNFDQYAGPPLEFGRMETTLSDPGVQQQFGMRVGIPNAGQLNALETLNIRGERSVICQGDFDSASVEGRAAAWCPAACEAFRKQPDALERAAELDAQYGSKPDLESCRCTASRSRGRTGTTRRTCARPAAMTSTSRWMRRTDSPDIADLRAKGAISLAIANAARTGQADAAAGEARRSIVLLDSNLAVRRVGRAAVQSVRHRARAARIELRIGRVRSPRISSHCSICEQTLRVVQRARLQEQRRQSAHDQGNHDGRRHGLPGISDRAGIHLPHGRGRGARCSMP